MTPQACVFWCTAGKMGGLRAEEVESAYGKGSLGNGKQYQCLDHKACEDRILHPPKRVRTKTSYTH